MPYKTSEFVKLLEENPEVPLHIMLPNGKFVPRHFHVTEVGKVRKDFIDCGGTKRKVVACVLQVWVANDTDHRLFSDKLAKIMKLAGPLLGKRDLPLEIEYSEEFVSQYPVDEAKVTVNRLTPGLNRILMILGGKQTACLAPDKCGVNNCCRGTK